MPPLRGGRVADFSNSMAEVIEQALAQEHLAVTGRPLPAEYVDERRMLLAAIGRGVLDYLKAHQDELVLTITLDSGAGPITFTVRGLNLNYP